MIYNILSILSIKHVYKYVFAVDLCLQLVLNIPVQTLMYSINNHYYNKLFTIICTIFYRILIKMLYLVK